VGVSSFFPARDLRAPSVDHRETFTHDTTGRTFSGTPTWNTECALHAKKSSFQITLVKSLTYL